MDIYSTRCIRKANSIVDDHIHPSHTLFTHLPSGKSKSPSLKNLIFEDITIQIMRRSTESEFCKYKFVEKNGSRESENWRETWKVN
ncbi:hypothetical protein QTP70_006340 [Hemibagrus guttatus]|uniref:Uncharacterized protein n=1 Tax=Hemibagrus guttatus TaxID=175788 RepID=A0AAE0QQD9_9TELE|nr:hypothetical protein QTP70_006340 [Hemibagrus guttatus]